ncbi:MAG: hypothetical protein QOF76_5429, partial [Solirubrobacteraceae bacterium]|nr:hypothetical protein [Solirubrobacteraceae bacterium]
MRRARVVQVHPSLWCNLACAHCYSSSGPAAKAALDPALVTGLLQDAAGQGYDAIAVSGGEPLLYKGLHEVIAAARDLGMRTSLTTNAMPVTRRAAGQLRGIDLVAVSVDGPPESHNASRGSDRAFPLMHRGVGYLRESGIPFGMLFMLTQHNVNELDWVACFAVREGAALLQIHPLELAGRASGRTDTPDSIEMSWALIEALRLRRDYKDRLHVHLDAAPAARLTELELFGADEDAELSRLVPTIVLEADGTVVPVQHGFPRRFAFGDLHTESF